MAASIDPDGATSLSTSTTPYTVNIGSRKSLLAIRQSEIVMDLLKKAWPEYNFHVEAISTMGDKDQKTALHQFNAKALWTFELEAMLFEGKVDLIVHSCKDIPTQLPPKSTIGAIVSRDDPRDAFVLHPSLPSDMTLGTLPENSLIGTSSVRRTAQLKRLYPHLRFESVRGNVGTRLRKLDESIPGSAPTQEADGTMKPNYSAIILAAAGLIRVDEGHRITRFLSSRDTFEGKKGMLHAVGQGALGVQIREGDEKTIKLLAPLRDQRTSLACFAERSLMRALEGGCSVPIGVETEWSDGINPGVKQGPPAAQSVSDQAVTGSANVPLGKDVALKLRAIVVSVDGQEHVETETSRVVTTDAEAEMLGLDVSKELTRLGAGKILEKINLDRKVLEAQDNA